MPRVIIKPHTVIFLLSVALTDRSAAILLPIAASLIHEAGHLIAMTALGCGIKELEITMFGAEIRTADDPGGTRERVIIFAAGGAANLLCAAASIPFAAHSFPLYFFAACSLALAAVNLLPIRTLDGGCILEALAWHFFPAHADIIVNTVSSVFLFILWLASAYLLLLCGGNFSLFLLCMYLFTSLYLK